jgi:DNA-binding GntR family transcriptional regulator
MASIIPRPVVPPRGPLALYEVIAADLREQIENGQFEVGSPLPTVAELAAKDDVAAGTVNRAVALLRESGLVDVSRGRRATVRRLP